MVEPQIVVLDVAGSSPVGHPIFPSSQLNQRPPEFGHVHGFYQVRHEAGFAGTQEVFIRSVAR